MFVFVFLQFMCRHTLIHSAIYNDMICYGNVILVNQTVSRYQSIFVHYELYSVFRLLKNTSIPHYFTSSRLSQLQHGPPHYI